MDIRKFFGKRIVQSAPSNGLGVGSSEVGKDEVASSIARAQYAKKSPFFERSSPPKRILADDSSNIEADQTCLNPAVKRPKLVDGKSHPAELQNSSDIFIGSLRLDSCPQDPATSSTSRQEVPAQQGFSMVSAQVRSLEGGLAICTNKPNLQEDVKHNPSRNFQHKWKNDLWSEKHRPRSSTDLVGNQQMVYRLREWLSRWAGNFSGRAQFTSSSKGKGKLNEEPRKAALLSGPPGIGKTSTALIVSRELGYEVLEVNASDARGKADAEVKHGMVGRTSNIIKELVTNQCVTVDMSSPHKKMLLLMDEVDGMSGGDRGGIQDLIKSIQKSKIPIICICNDKYDRKLQSLLGHCMELNFQKPAKHEVFRRLSSIAKRECLQVPDRSLDMLLDSVQFDIRLALNQLQYRSSGGLYKELQNSPGELSKDLALTPFTAADRLLFRSKDMTVNEQIDLVFHDGDLVPLLIQENYLNFVPNNDRREDVRMELIAQAADSLSLGDIVSRHVRQRQRWDLLPFACVQSAVTCASLVRGVRQTFFPGERNFNRFAGWLGKNSTAGKNGRLLSDVQLHLLVSGTCPASRSAVRMDYLPHFCRSLVVPLKEKDKAGVADVIGFMEEYSLTREDRDAILDIAQMKGVNKILESIPAQVKATFTRTLNQKSGERIVKSSAMLPNFKVNKKSQANVVPTVSVDGIVTVEGTEMLDDDNVDAEQEEDAETVIPGVTRRNVAAARSQQNGSRTKSKRGSAPSTTRSTGLTKRGRSR